ncbi:unnamed protein product [Acanthosepion pharaonis]|uniref:Uncharacterized protein n=1 Tax=Acanthosepion pharaonis TaxID=158019 RepID=A0A812E7L2_ACAPH|nr:unnamed protein product [Sepia pharaonis]
MYDFPRCKQAFVDHHEASTLTHLQEIFLTPFPDNLNEISLSLSLSFSLHNSSHSLTHSPSLPTLSFSLPLSLSRCIIEVSLFRYIIGSHSFTQSPLSLSRYINKVSLFRYKIGGLSGSLFRYIIDGLSLSLSLSLFRYIVTGLSFCLSLYI